MPLEPVEAECSSSDGTVEIDINGAPISDSNPLPVDVVAGSISIDPGDIEIGAVEIKSATNDNRAEVDLPANLSGADLVLGVHDPLAATATAQTTGNNSLAAIDAGTPAALGQTTMAASQPVTIASDQAAVPVSSATLATAANQTTANASLASIDSGTPAALGSATSANSMPVVIASDQAAVATKVSDGANATIGTTTDAAVVTNANGTVIGFLRGLVSMFAGRTAKVDVAGAGASGAAVSGNPVLVAGADATNARTLLTDGLGRQVVVGAAAAGSAIAGNPLYIAGTDGTLVRALRTMADNADGMATNSSPVFLQSVAEQWAYNGTTWDRARTPTVFKTLNAVSVAAETTIWTPTSGKKFRIMGFVITQGSLAGNVLLKDNTAGTTILIVPAAVVQTPVTVSIGNGILSAAANNVLTATGSSTQTISGFVYGTEE